MNSTSSFEKGLQLLDAGDYKACEDLFQNKLNEASDKERKTREYANNLLWLGHVQLKLDDNENARDNLSQAENLYRELGGDNQENLANAMTKHGEALTSLERTSEAHDKLEEALKLAKEVCGSCSVQVSDTLTALGLNYLKKNDLDKADQYLSKAYGMRKGIYGANSEIAMSLNHLSVCYSQADNFTPAQVMAIQALEMQKPIIGDEHPDYGISLLNLATVYVKQGRMPKAEPYASEAVEVFKKKLPEYHSLNIWAKDRLGSIKLSAGENQEAREIYTGSLKLAQKKWGKDSPNTIGSLIGLGLASMNCGDYESSEKYLSIALDMMQHSPQVNPSIEYSILQQLACSYVFQLKLSDAVRLVPDSLRARHTADFNDTMDTLHKVSNFLSKQIENWKDKK